MPNRARAAVSSKTIGVQAGVISFVDEGTEKVLDVLQELAYVNTLFLAAFTYGRALREGRFRTSRRPITASRSRTSSFTAEISPRRNAQYYRSTILKDTRAPDHETSTSWPKCFPRLRSAA